MTTTNISIRMDSELKAKTEQPNSETTAALLEAERIARDPSVKGYTNLNELFTGFDKMKRPKYTIHSGDNHV